MTKLFNRFTRDESGATLIEYSLLIGLITVVAVVTVGLVGTWVGLQWNELLTAINAA